MSQNLRSTTTMRLGSLLLNTVLAACTVGPDYSTPKTEPGAVPLASSGGAGCRGIKLIPTATGSAPAGRCQVATRYHRRGALSVHTRDRLRTARRVSGRWVNAVISRGDYRTDPNVSNPVHSA